jgi:hypothetical protein
MQHVPDLSQREARSVQSVVSGRFAWQPRTRGYFACDEGTGRKILHACVGCITAQGMVIRPPGT